MPFIEGKKISETLEDLDWEDICQKIGASIAKLHDNNIIHGDLTTSNMILKKDKVFFIDFGLSFISGRIEDKACDLHLIKQALEAKNIKMEEAEIQLIPENTVKVDGKDAEHVLKLM
jgi:Kae1-associated kinase Bud32